MKRALPRRQRGMTLLVGLIMLVLLLLMAVSSFNLTRTNSAVTGNMQYRQETINAAMQATEQVITTTRFLETPTDAVAGTCGTNKVCVDVNGDTKPDVTVNLGTPCIRKVQVIKVANLNDKDPLDEPCMLGVKQAFGTAGAATGDSLCAASIWEITAEATDEVMQAKSTVVTGVAARVSVDAATDTTKVCTY